MTRNPEADKTNKAVGEWIQQHPVWHKRLQDLVFECWKKTSKLTVNAVQSSKWGKEALKSMDFSLADYLSYSIYYD